MSNLACTLTRKRPYGPVITSQNCPKKRDDRRPGANAALVELAFSYAYPRWGLFDRHSSALLANGSGTDDGRATGAGAADQRETEFSPGAQRVVAAGRRKQSLRLRARGWGGCAFGSSRRASAQRDSQLTVYPSYPSVLSHLARELQPYASDFEWIYPKFGYTLDALTRPPACRSNPPIRTI